MKSHPVLVNLDQEEIIRARSMSPDEKMLERLRLFDQGYQRLTDRIRAAFPTANDATVQALLHQVLRRLP